MNHNRIIHVAKFLERFEDTKTDMKKNWEFHQTNKGLFCMLSPKPYPVGYLGGLAGWTVYVAGDVSKFLPLGYAGSYVPNRERDDKIYRFAQAWLGLTDQQATDLFTPQFDPNNHERMIDSFTAKDAAECLCLVLRGTDPLKAWHDVLKPQGWDVGQFNTDDYRGGYLRL